MKVFLRKILKSNFVNLIFHEFFWFWTFLISWTAVFFFFFQTLKPNYLIQRPARTSDQIFFCPLMHILHYIYLNLISWTLKIISLFYVFLKLFRRQLRKAVVDHVSDSFLEPDTPLLMLLAAAREGHEKEVSNSMTFLFLKKKSLSYYF